MQIGYMLEIKQPKESNRFQIIIELQKRDPVKISRVISSTFKPF